MKAFKVTVYAAIIVATGVVVGYMSYQKNQKPVLSELAMANVEALTNGEEGLPGNQSDCHSKCGAWNAMSVCEASGFESATCKISGKVSVFGVEVSGSFEKGKQYNIAWARYRCVDSTGNCCIKQGVYTGNEKLA